MRSIIILQCDSNRSSGGLSDQNDHSCANPAYRQVLLLSAGAVLAPAISGNVLLAEFAFGWLFAAQFIKHVFRTRLITAARERMHLV
jgi:hypothetical protein